MPIGARRVIINNAAAIAANAPAPGVDGGAGSPIGLLLALTKAE